MSAPIDVPYRVVVAKVAELVLGYDTDGGVNFEWKPYHQRTPEARRDYDRLEASIRAHGLKKPLLTYRGHVLIGMRRAEILAKLGVEHVACWEILDDVSKWATADLVKLDWLKARVGAHGY